MAGYGDTVEVLTGLRHEIYAITTDTIAFGRVGSVFLRGEEVV
ncbi:hypothetical protein Maes01_02723 [Microbulbifer aestuariivivens]|uniref:Uncharacterized protein n=1 Tax=Microbulbifer aestuariivivens TaxID=1908308 RepID=A0ABP9WSE1_9GAMM